MEGFTAKLFVLVIFLSCASPVVEIGSNQVKPHKTVVLDSLLHPWSICFLNEHDVVISEKDGHLIRANLSAKSKKVIAGFPSDLADSIRAIDFRDNAGIFDVVKHPKFDDNHWIYISYAAENNQGTTTKVIRAKLVDTELIEIVTIFVADPYSKDRFHYGGGMTFGQDGTLYVTIGERLFNEIDQPTLPIAQDVRDKRGKIYRLHDDGTIPDDNPQFGEEAVEGLFAIGIRAAQGITSHPEDGSIWFSEHGSVQGDEINLLIAGANYGWPVKTSGKYRNDTYIPPKLENVVFTEPKYSWQKTIAPTGLVFYQGTEFHQWNGDILMAGLSRGSLWRIRSTDHTIRSLEELFVDDPIRSRKVAISPEGQLYLLTDEPNGKVVLISNTNHKD